MATCNCCGCLFISDSETSTVFGVGSISDPFTVGLIDPNYIRKMARVRRTTNQTIPNNTETAVSWTNAQVDTGTFWSAGSPTRLTIQTTGLYVFGITGIFTSNATGIRRYGFRLNGTTTLDYTEKQPPVMTYFCHQYQWPLNAGDYLEMTLLQTSGGNLDIATGGGFFTDPAHGWIVYMGKVV